jgi:hypothetical protein
MANGAIGQFAVFVTLAGILLCLIVVFRNRRARLEQPLMVRQVDAPQVKAIAPLQNTQAELAQTAIVMKPADAQLQVTRVITVETVSPVIADVVKDAVDTKPPIVVHAQPIPVREDRNQKILAGISENLRKSNQSRPVMTYSPVHFAEKPRDTEYVRVKKQIITPHGQVRFSILKDSISTNMLALFRRASLGWKTPEDLIGFLPSYLEAEAEIIDHGLLVIGTPGHNEKLAVPIRSIDATSSFRDCFDFDSDPRTATNTPAVLVASDGDYEIVSQGVISTVFLNPADGDAEMKLLADRFSMQKNFAVALPPPS